MDTTYVAQRRVSGSSVVCTTHPVLGTFYWQFISNADCNAPDHYELTVDIRSALRIAGDWRQHRPNLNPYSFAQARDIYPVAKRCGVSRAEVRQWLRTTSWQSTPAPDKLYWFGGMDGFWGDTPEWTEYLSEAKEFSKEDVDNKSSDDIDCIAARVQGTFVRKIDAMKDFAELQAASPDSAGVASEGSTEEHPFTMNITAIEQDNELFFGLIIRFAVTGTLPTDDAIEELLERVWRSRVDDDDEDEMNGFGLHFDPATRSGHWYAESNAIETLAVGNVYMWNTCIRTETQPNGNPNVPA